MIRQFKVATRRYITLIEIMIVMFIIALITGVIAYNYTGSLDEGKAFKTVAGMEKLQTILQLAIANNPDLQNNIDNPEIWKKVISESPLVSNATSLMQDGWGNTYEIYLKNGTVVVYSQKYDDYRTSKSTLFNKPSESSN